MTRNIPIVASAIALATIRVAAVAQPSAPDLNTPGEEHRALDALLGTWDVTVSFPAGPDRQMEGSATCVATWEMDGRFLRQEYSSSFMGRPLTVVRYLGFDRHRDRFVEIQFESTHTDVMHNEGSISADGRTITATGSHVDASTGKLVEVRTVTSIQDEETFITEMHYGDVRNGDAKTITLAHRRR